MDNEVFFDIGLKWGGFKSELQQMAANSRNFFGSMDAAINKTQNYLNRLGGTTKINIDSSSIDNAEKKADELGKKLRRLGENDPTESSERGGMGFMATSGAMMLGNMAARAAMFGIDKAVEAGKSMLESGMNVQNMKVGMSTFVGDKKANEIVEDVMISSAKTPYTTQALLPGIRGLMATGLDYERAKKDIWGLANAIAATGGTNDNLARTAMEMQHAAAKGKVDGMVLRDFMNNGLPIFPLLQRSLPELKGMSNARAKEKLEDEGISYDKLSYALDRASKSGGMFDGALEKLSGTIGGKWSTIMDYWQMGGAKLVLSQDNAITHIEDKIIAGLKGFPYMIERFTPTVDRLFSEFDDLWPSLEDFGKALWDDIKPFDALLPVSKGLLDFGDAILLTVKPALEGLAVLARDTVIPAFNSLAATAKQMVQGKLAHEEIDAEGNIITNTSSFWSDLKTTGSYLWHLTDGMAMQRDEDRAFFEKNMSPGVHENYGVEPLAFYKQPAYDKSIFSWSQSRNLSFFGVGSGVKEPFFNPYLNKKPFEKAANDLEADSDKVVGGGKKIMNLNFHAPLIKIDHQNFNEVKDAVRDMEPRLKEMLVRLFAGVPA